MRALEFLIEERVRLFLKDFIVTVSSHAHDQFVQRNVKLDQIENIIRNLSSVRDKIMGMGEQAEFILHNGKGTALGMRKGPGKNLILGTVYRTAPNFTKGKHPTFLVTTPTQ